MDWKPISEEDLWDRINSAWDKMTLPQRRLWEVIRIYPQKWRQHPYGDEGGGFWAVAVIGVVVVWYNDIEDGFNRSHYIKFGEIVQYYSNQDELQWTVQHILNEILDGQQSGFYAGPPVP